MARIWSDVRVSTLPQAQPLGVLVGSSVGAGVVGAIPFSRIFDHTDRDTRRECYGRGLARNLRRRCGGVVGGYPADPAHHLTIRAGSVRRE